MNRKIGVIASDAELKNSIIELFPEDVEQGKVIIDILDSNKMEEQGRILESKGAKAIVARSGGYIYTVSKVNVPVVHLKITTLDILRAVKIASIYKKQIVLFISIYEYFDYDELKDLIKTNITIERYRIKEEIEDRVRKYIDRSKEFVIVGGGIPCSCARKQGIDNVHIGASRESIHEAITYAKELVDGLYEQRYKNEVLKTILDGVHDAVIAIDAEGKIILYNERAEELLKKDSKDVMDKKLLEVYPELGFMIEVLKDKINQYNKIKKLRKIIITSNTSVLEVDGNINGVLCSFQDITKLQNLEKKIRYEMNKKGLVAKHTFKDIIAYDSIMQDTVAKAIKIGLTDSTVMICGESGTGKEIVAQSIHNISSRKEEPFVVVNCAAISESLLESELFGYEEGAFTGARKGGKPGLFELAHGGTIFLDEINSMSLSLQAKLLRVLEEKEVMRIGSDYVIPLDVRVIAAANEDLKKKVRDGNFRSDLFYRLNILKLSIPPLRQRTDDIIPLFKYYLKGLSEENDELELSCEDKNRIVNHTWPGNVRELKNVAQRYVLFHELDLDEYEDEGEGIQYEKMQYIDSNVSLRDMYQSIEEKMIEILSNQGMTKTEIAKQLGISRTALWKKKRVQD
ncbi:sigma 54-interacting transcriptional regulator [Clostridium magnum]|uniref:Arginine utilization regulatory protein RocR n=1 Tax=Clostridium magnum DSM 2767 TaxID=1121326 RepID=A0A161WVH8_9CLOT|nr:sigma 54-interacting transcriptional regulator [Clostridium magnum]KZL90908.1 arginine utilization regulatory protein RocR [Clostridium magnum DSM 2767]SHI12881.1 transcriptional regulator, propionate catabolism operon regulatory protein [Clostridium magnum DSM 2767]